MYITVDWARFESLSDTNSWTMYYKAHGSTSYSLWCGTSNHQLRCMVEGADKTDFDDNHKTGSTSVACEGDALTRLITF
jgi:hypothetical protein